MGKLIDEQLEIIGKSGKLYSFSVYDRNAKFKKGIGGIYIYAKLTTQKKKDEITDNFILIYCGKTHDFNERDTENHHKMKHIHDNEADCICVKRIDSKDKRTFVEIDILEGNDFVCNTQHNTNPTEED